MSAAIAAIEHYRTFPYLKCVQSRFVEFPVCRKTYEQHRQRIVAARPAVDSGFCRRGGQLPLTALSSRKLDMRLDDREWIRNRQERVLKFSEENSSRRRREMEKLAVENKVLSKRLESQESRYDRDKHRRDWLLHEERVARISKYNHSWRSAGNLQDKIGFLPPINGVLM